MPAAQNQYDEGAAVKVVILRDEDQDGKWHAEQTPAASGGGLTDAQLRASPVPVTGGGGGTEYTEGIASPADPAAGARNYRYRSALISEVTTDGFWVTANATVKGEQYVKHVDPIPATQSGAWTSDVTDRIARLLGHVIIDAGTAVIGHVITDSGSTTVVTGTVTVDTELEAAAAFADATANPTASRLGSYLFGYNGVTWDRLRSTTANGLAVDVTRVQGTVDVGDRAGRLVGVVDTELPAAAALADATANPTTPIVAAAVEGFNGTTWDRIRAGTVAPVGTEQGLMTRNLFTDSLAPLGGGTDTLTTTGSLAYTVPNGEATMHIRGNIANASNSYAFEGSIDGTVWIQVPWMLSTPTAPFTSFSYANLALVTGDIDVLVACTGFKQVRIRRTAAGTGTDTWQSRFSNQPAFLTVVGPILTKSSQQGGAGFQTQDYKDAGRTRINLLAAQVTPAAADTLVTIQKTVGGTVTTGVTEYVVTAGKTLRVQSIGIEFSSSSAAVTRLNVRLRRATVALTTGAALELGWHLADAAIAAPAAADEGWVTASSIFPDGMEFAAADHIGFTANATTAVGIMTIRLTGFEY